MELVSPPYGVIMTKHDLETLSFSHNRGYKKDFSSAITLNPVRNDLVHFGIHLFLSFCHSSATQVVRK
jgi:hypothetical protein